MKYGYDIKNSSFERVWDLLRYSDELHDCMSLNHSAIHDEINSWFDGKILDIDWHFDGSFAPDNMYYLSVNILLFYQGGFGYRISRYTKSFRINLNGTAKQDILESLRNYVRLTIKGI